MPSVVPKIDASMSWTATALPASSAPTNPLATNQVMSARARECTSAGPVTLPFDERGGLIVLVDPGRSTPHDARALAERAAQGGACGFLVGDSLGVRETISAHVAAIRRGDDAL